MKIHEALIAINRKVGAIGKNRKNQEQGYTFRGIDDAYNELHTLFAEEGVIILPHFIRSVREERPRRNGGVLIYSISTYDFDFIADDGSKVTARLQGEGMDTGDKSLNKSFSAALKYALLSMFLIPTQEPKDSESDSPEPAAKIEKPANAAMPYDRFNNLIKSIKAQPDKAAEWLATARKQFSFTDDQEKVLADWESSL